MIKDFASTIDVDSIDKEERRQIKIFCWIIFSEYVGWRASTAKCKERMQEGALHIRAFGGTGHETAMEYRRAKKLARDMADRYSAILISKISYEVLEKYDDDMEMDDFPEELKQAYQIMEAKEAAILDREYYHRIYDYMDRINGILKN